MPYSACMAIVGIVGNQSVQGVSSVTSLIPTPRSNDSWLGDTCANSHSMWKIQGKGWHWMWWHQQDRPHKSRGASINLLPIVLYNMWFVLHEYTCIFSYNCYIPWYAPSLVQCLGGEPVLEEGRLADFLFLSNLRELKRITVSSWRQKSSTSK